jgi:hypothetical protein
VNSLDAELPHQPAHPLLATGQAMGEAKLGPHPRRPVGAPGEVVDGGDQELEPFVLSPTLTGRP